MKFGKLVRRFLVPASAITVYCLWKHRARVSPRAEVELSRHLVLGRKSVIGSFTKVKSAEGPLEIGPRTSVSSGCTITSGTGGLRIGADCLIGPSVSIISNTYRYDRIDVPFREQGTTSKGVRIGENVFVGTGARILDGAEIGDGAMIAANAVVTGKIPANAIVDGNPAKVVFVRR